MESRLNQAKADSHLSEMANQFGEMLGIDYPMPINVFEAAVDNWMYARHLLGSKDYPEVIRMLMDNPPKKKILQAVSKPRKSNALLVKNATKALLRWAKSGFSTVDEEIFQRRIKNCRQCKYLVHSSDRINSKTTNKEYESRGVCSACGCSVTKKAKLASETCPMDHPILPGLNLWGESISD